jgi:hypothetical protein
MMIAMMTMIKETIGSLNSNDADGLQTKDTLEMTSKQQQIYNRRKDMRPSLVILVYSRMKRLFWQILPKHLDSQMTQFDVIESLMVDEEGLLTTLHLLAFTAKANNEDTPNYSQTMNGPDALGYMEVMEKEMQQLEDKHPWDIIPISDVPEGANILDSTWADGRVRKLKARLCV